MRKDWSDRHQDIIINKIISKTLVLCTANIKNSYILVSVVTWLVVTHFRLYSYECPLSTLFQFFLPVVKWTLKKNFLTWNGKFDKMVFFWTIEMKFEILWKKKIKKHFFVGVIGANVAIGSNVTASQSSTSHECPAYLAIDGVHHTRVITNSE